MNMDKAKVGEVYRDPDGGLWKVIAAFSEPTVSMQMVYDKKNPGNHAVPRLTGGVTGTMWDGFSKVEQVAGDES